MKCLFWFLISLASANPIDYSGEVLKSSPAKRVVSLVPSLGELGASLLGAEALVGVSEATDYPDSLSSKTSVGPYSAFNVEKVLSLKPDLVLATRDGNPRDRVLRLRELGLNVLVISTQSIEEVRNSIQLIGRATGKLPQAQEILSRIDRRLGRLKSPKRKPLKTLIQVDSNPLVVMGASSFLSEVAEWVGAINLYHDVKKTHFRPSLEDVILRKPDVVLILTFKGEDRHKSEKSKKDWLRLGVPRVEILRSDGLLRAPSERFVDGVAEMKATLK